MNKEAGQDYLPEKISVLGELSGRMRQAGHDSYKDRRDDEEFPPPPPVFQTYAAQLSGKDDEDDLPPPPTPLQSGNLLSTLTPRLFITPSPFQSPLPPPPLVSSSLDSDIPPSPDQCVTPQPVPYNSCLTSSSSSTPLPPRQTATPWLSNSLRSISSNSISSNESLPRKDNSVGRFSEQAGKVERRDSFDSAGMLRELDKIRRQCYGCSEEVQSGGCTANGRTFHKECFKCSNCKKMLEEKFFTAEDEPLCENCYKVDDKTCDICSKAIAGDCLMSKGKHFHQDCMKCSVCGEVLSGTYFTAMDKLICEKDYRETEKSCSDCGCVISGPYYTLDNEKVVCETDYKKMLGNCERCREVVEGKILKVSGGFYHPDCFTCVVCKESLVGVPFSLDDDKLAYCSEDYKKKHAVQCSACSQPIVPKRGETSAARLRALGRDFHPECFKCEDCGLVLDSRISGSECYPVDNKPLCAACSRNRQE
eukprot:TRINITY_DN6882_c0_g1_i4.p1 TRINITY_DN6882_c0_g1~~TRINITY_DN6882_c0_g1_i4.p1  ORF type:complete len:478 (-),score=147.06 TRINITY_DN6882_c0_g1_i4:159-1592(-)